MLVYNRFIVFEAYIYYIEDVSYGGELGQIMYFLFFSMVAALYHGSSISLESQSCQHLLNYV